MSGLPEEIVPSSTAATPNQGPSPSALQSSIAAAIANFKPSSRDVISGIAPHVFDERRRRLRPRRSSTVIKRASRSFESSRLGGATESSPLRVSAVITVDEHGIVVTQPHRKPDIVQPVELLKCTSRVDSKTEVVVVSPKVDKPRWRSLRIDIGVIKKTISIKFRPAARSTL